MLAILLTGLTVTANAAETGWVKKDGNWYYFKADGTMVTSDWVQTSGKWYYLGEDGVMKANEVFTDGKKWYAADKNGAMVANGWFEEKNGDDDWSYSEWYYAGADGALVKGWKLIGKKWYCFEDWADAEVDYKPWMAQGTIWTFKKTSYAFKPSGEMIVGWGQPFLGSQWYDQSNTEWVTNWVYANADGSLVEGWKKIDGKWYYLYPIMMRNGVLPFDEKGEIGYGEKKTDFYGFNASGAMIENAWYKEPDSGNSGGGWYYFGADGAAKKGWFQDKGKWYYLHEKYGYMETGLIPMSDGKVYYLDETTGAMATGWKQIDNIWYYFKDSGAMTVKEWVKSGSAWYYLKEDGQMAKDEILTIDGKPYKFDANGVWVP